ncbi:flippase activity-associated protein Agl23 [Halosegnis marinus]|uniref:Flippase activity-associated protein Agl23 n=1 Tax=Halosegnis marinus TaxID=3034023 RepID=A0ABD5ZRU5_9EURY|nr:flippase activity-associated protein Agl23 [Halosegnis sp. DT85]
MTDLRSDRVVQAVAGLAVVALLARLVLLGARPAHYDEGRVAFWTLHYLETGEFHYRFIIHGPLVQHVGAALFGLLGANDFTARLPVALAGGLLPLSALWFRHRLSDTEVGALAFFLAANPLLLYYGRFMRSSVLVAAFCFVAFAAFVRAYDGFGVRYLYLGSASLALGFGAKENAILYVLCWLGAAALLLDARLFRPRGPDSGVSWLAGRYDALRERLAGRGTTPTDWVVRWAAHGALAGLLFAVLFVFLYAPRGGDWVGLYDALANPLLLPEMLSTTADQVAEGYGYWFGGGGERTVTEFIESLGYLLRPIAAYAGPLVGLALAGFLVERWGSDSPRPFVMGAAYWGLVSIPGYALGTDINNPWILTNALVPLAIPAAVGLALVVDTGREALATDDEVNAGIVAVLLLLVVGSVVGGAAAGVYTNTTEPDNRLVQFAQPSADMRPAVDALVAASAENEGTDALFYDATGDLVDMQTDAPRTPACIRWFNALSLPWYLEAHDVATDCADTPGALPDDLPPVVVVIGDCTLPTAVECRANPDAMVPPGEMEGRLDGYERYAYLHRTTGGNDFDGFLVYVESDA